LELILAEPQLQHLPYITSKNLFTFGAGDSIEENRKLLEELRKLMNPVI